METKPNRHDRRTLALLAFDSYTLNNLSAYTLNNLSAYTLKNLPPDIQQKHKDFWDSVPLVVMPYTTLLRDINEKKRCHQQSTFGDLKDFDPARNICGFAMCTGGHLVHMAGQRGWELKEELGYEGAAYVIHRKAHPDLPCQNFGYIPQKLALAYIETMAAIEQGTETKFWEETESKPV